ncbi:MAG: GlmU family protein [Tenuifilaceae bacterium]|jgi:UDP-N-acetylglucosamine diphosphorylase/glucosamine-1-phosphate N-acetyltransferase|nr:GlmU family protein [Tenuifilaceae bacterium]
MSNTTIILFDDKRREHLLPLTFTRPVADIRIGILTIKEKWEQVMETSCGYLTVDYLSKKFTTGSAGSNILLINGGVIPSSELANQIKNLELNSALTHKGAVIAARTGSIPALEAISPQLFTSCIEIEEPLFQVERPWDIFSKNGIALEKDFELITKGRKSAPISKTNQVIRPERVFIEHGATVECAILNASTGPIYIAKDAEIMEGSIVRGPFSLGEHSALKMGAKIYGPTTIGPHSKVGGEVNNSVIFGFSNKAHDGFLGNSVLGEWCNLGADTNNSNLKNNYAPVKLWDYSTERFANTGLQFCGLIMGDHSKCGINTMFNTGSVVGVSANIFGSGFPRNFIPSFSWGGAHGFEVYTMPKVLQTVKIVLSRRGLELEQVDIDILAHIFEVTQKYRKF